MCLHITSLNSGSNGNCYYIANQEEAILVDAGISCRETEKRMFRLGLSMESVKAIFVSHEHHDHIRGVPQLSKKYNIPVYITQKTLEHGSLTLEPHLIRIFNTYQKIVVGALQISAFAKYHDAIDPHSFIVKCEDVTVGIFTDIGTPCATLINHFKICHAAFLEANYDEQMLASGEYPYHLKRRITGGRGHLSNRQALDVFMRHKPTFMSHLFLSHLSKDNNCPILAEKLFKANAGDTEVVIASRNQETQVFSILNKSNKNVLADKTRPEFVEKSRVAMPQYTQYSLF